MFDIRLVEDNAFTISVMDMEQIQSALFRHLNDGLRRTLFVNALPPYRPPEAG